MTSGPENPDSGQEPDSVQDENYLLAGRRQKLQNLRDRGIDPYPHSYDRSHTTAEALALFDVAEDESGEGTRSEDVSVAGRIIRYRRMGKATFLDLQDGNGKLQVLLRRNNIPDSYDDLRELDIGDFLGVVGPMFRTRTGEATMEAPAWTILSKSLRPPPEKFHGPSDVVAR